MTAQSSIERKKRGGNRVYFECEVEFHNPQTLDLLDNIIEYLKRLSSNDSSSNEETEKLGKNHNNFVREASFFGDPYCCKLIVR